MRVCIGSVYFYHTACVKVIVIHLFMLLITHIIYILYVRGYISTYSLVIETPNEENKFEIRKV